MQSGNEPTAAGALAGNAAQLWYNPAPGAQRDLPSMLTYRAAVLGECILNFRSLKAGVNSSEEVLYTAWLPEGDLPINWDTPALERVDTSLIEAHPAPHVAAPVAPVELTGERRAEIEADLIATLVRRERLVLLYNPLFGLFSAVRESKEDFLARTAEVALQEIEPELKQLKQVFELQLEQVREAQVRQSAGALEESGELAPEGKAEVERLLLRRTEFFQAENRLSSLFTGLAGSVLAMPSLRPRSMQNLPGATAELHEDLLRIEREAADALNQLYTRYLEMVRSYDTFEIGIQPTNVRVVRCALLWVPVLVR
jgi:hypothetical protein